jgi:hypothetical protein
MLRQLGESFVWSVSHERLYASGGARMFWARGSISMMIMGAPQCWQRKVGAVARRSLRLRGAGLEQCASGGEMLLACGIGEEAIVADAMEAAGEHVQQEAAHELCVAQSHGLVASVTL